MLKTPKPKSPKFKVGQDWHGRFVQCSHGAKMITSARGMRFRVVALADNCALLAKLDRSTDYREFLIMTGAVEWFDPYGQQVDPIGGYDNGDYYELTRVVKP